MRCAQFPTDLLLLFVMTTREDIPARSPEVALLNPIRFSLSFLVLATYLFNFVRCADESIPLLLRTHLETLVP